VLGWEEGNFEKETKRIKKGIGVGSRGRDRGRDRKQKKGKKGEKVGEVEVGNG